MSKNNEEVKKDQANCKSNDKGNSYKSNRRNNRRKPKTGNKPNNNRNYDNKDSNPDGRKGVVIGMEKGDRDNDPNWYFESKEIADQVMNYSFETVLGLDPVIEEEIVPTVATVYMLPSPGNSYSVDEKGQWQTTDLLPSVPNLGYDGANFMAAKLYTLLSAYSGRNAQYQPNDILMAILSQSSILEAIESLRRCFGLLFTYSVFNRTVPRKLIEGVGIDFDDLIANSADYRSQLNYQISRINQIPIFGNIAYVSKSLEMYQRVYQDEEDTPYAQLIQYAPALLWQLDEQTYSTGSVLKTIDWFCKLGDETSNKRGFSHRTTKIKMSDLITILSGMISEVLNSTTLNLVYMDLIHLASKISGVKFIALDYVSDTYAVTPSYDKNFMLQFHNLKMMGTLSFYSNSASTTPIMQIGSSNMYTTQLNDVATDPNTGRIFYNPSFAQNVAWQSIDTVVDFNEANPSLEDRVEAQRFTCTRSNYHWSSSGTGNTAFFICNITPDHFPVLIVIHEAAQPKSDYSGLERRDIQIYQTEINSSLDLTGTTALANVKTAESIIIRSAHALSKFHHAPFVHIFLGTTFFSSIGDLTYFTKIPFYKQSRMNQVMYSGMFAFRV